MSMDRKFTGGLVAAALLALGAAGCAADKGRLASAEPRGPVQATADAGITAKVKIALAADKQGKYFEVHQKLFTVYDCEPLPSIHGNRARPGAGRRRKS